MSQILEFWLGWKSGFDVFNLSNFEQQFLLSLNSKADFWDLNAKDI